MPLLTILDNTYNIASAKVTFSVLLEVAEEHCYWKIIFIKLLLSVDIVHVILYRRGTCSYEECTWLVTSTLTFVEVEA